MEEENKRITKYSHFRKELLKTIRQDIEQALGVRVQSGGNSKFLRINYTKDTFEGSLNVFLTLQDSRFLSLQFSIQEVVTFKNVSLRPGSKTEIQTKAIETDTSLLDWKPYERRAVSDAIEKGQPVVIRFSADWCTNCKIIEKKVYSDKTVVDLIKAKGVLPMMADITTQVSPASKDLNDIYGEKSVPLTVYIAPDGTLNKLRGLFENAKLIKLLTKLPDVKPTVEVDGSGNILSDEVMEINKVLGDWFDNCSTGNVEAINKAWIPNNPKAGRDLKAMKKLMELNPGWKFSLLSVMWDKTEAMAVSGALQQGDLQVDGPMIFVWSLEKTDQGWKLTDIDLEELEGLQVENSRFMQRHPDANVWFDNPDWKAVKPNKNINMQVQGWVEGEKSLKVNDPQYVSRFNVKRPASNSNEVSDAFKEGQLIFNERVGFVVKDNANGIVHCIDFDTDRIIQIPADIDMQDKQVIRHWAESEGVDAVIHPNRFTTVNMAVVANEQWTKLDPHTFSKLKDAALSSGKELHAMSDGYSCHAFKSSNGRIGIVGLSFQNDRDITPHRLLIKYKLLRLDEKTD